MGILWEHSPWVFLLVTVALAGGAAWATGRALALGWHPYWQVVVYMLLLGCADRFLHWGLFLDGAFSMEKGELFSLQYYLVDTAILLAIGSLAHRLTKAGLMTRQYPWLYRRTGPFTWTEKSPAAPKAQPSK